MNKMASRTGKKGKKPLQTTLGKANCQNEKDVDLSHIQKPINTSIFGLRQVLSLFQTATKEVKNYIAYECDIMYECRICRTIFRSLANFILHKRDYCRERFNQPDIVDHNEDSFENTSPDSTEDVYIEESAPLCTDKMEESTVGVKKSLLPVIERLKEKQEICQLTKEVLNQDLSKGVEEESNELDMKNKHSDLLLEEIATNNAAVFQTVMQKLPVRNIRKPEFMKSEVMEIHGILDSDEAVLGPDGKICTFETNKINENPIIPKNDLFCTECNVKFSTRKTLTYHIKYKHNNTRLVYVCPDCKDTFANAWCVYRHLFKIHRKTSAQIKKMRDHIHNSCIRKDQEPIKKTDKKTTETLDKTDEENQWLSNIEGDNDFQMCGGCGKRFERKAALHSHAQMCTKRIAVCNTIKENNAKKKEEEVCKDFKTKNNKTEKTEVLKGSSKRKPYLLRTYKANEGDHSKESGESVDNCDVNANKASKVDVDNCDVNANCEIVETICDNKDIVDKDPTHIGLSSLSSLEDLSSPSKKYFVNSPSIEKIDTEKMFNIIGITTNYENKTSENMDSSKSPLDDKTSKSEQDCVKEVSRSHTARDFDLFCQSVAKSLFTDPLESSPELEEYPQKITKTIPLILRRRNNSKPEKRNAILDRKNETPENDSLEKKTQVDNTNPAKMENIAQTAVDTDETATNTPSSSNFKITVKSLEDLIGVSPQEHKKNLENNETDEEISNTRLDRLHDTSFSTNLSPSISDTLRANMSPKRLQEKYPKCLKRKRTSSFDVTECHGYAKKLKNANAQDNSFISKASPFMDQNELVCISCQITYPTLSKLLWHMSAHFSWFRFQCSRCSFISFNKMDCANHARKVHNVRKSSVPSVVLPIPNWKTVLMSHDFTILNDDTDLMGKHTDEVLSGSLDDAITEESSDEAVNDECEEWSNKLFLESSGVDYEVENDPLRSDILLEQGVSIKQENIDVIENDEESFQIEVPQEMYTLNASEIIEGVNYEEKYLYRTQVTRDQSADENDEEDNDWINHVPTLQKTEIIINETKLEAETILNVETEQHLSNDESGEVNNYEDRECFSKNSEPTTNLRPTRNRTRSIKTIQDDFFYDLNKVIKLNDTSVSKSNMLKLKKLQSQKNTKDCNSSNGKSDTQSIRVYAKK